MRPVISYKIDEKEREEEMIKQLQTQYRLIYTIDTTLQQLNDEMGNMSPAEIENDPLRQVVQETIGKFEVFFAKHHELLEVLVDEESYERIWGNFETLKKAFSKDDTQDDTQIS